MTVHCSRNKRSHRDTASFAMLPFNCYTGFGETYLCLELQMNGVQEKCSDFGKAQQKEAGWIMHLLTTLSTRSIHCMFGEATSFVGQKVTRDHVSCLLFFVFSFSIENFPCTRGQTTNRTVLFDNLCSQMISPPPFGRKDYDTDDFGVGLQKVKGKDCIFPLETSAPNAIFFLSILGLITQRECSLTQVMETRVTKGKVLVTQVVSFSFDIIFTSFFFLQSSVDIRVAAFIYIFLRCAKRVQVNYFVFKTTHRSFFGGIYVPP